MLGKGWKGKTPVKENIRPLPGDDYIMGNIHPLPGDGGELLTPSPSITSNFSTQQKNGSASPKGSKNNNTGRISDLRGHVLCRKYVLDRYLCVIVVVNRF